MEFDSLKKVENFYKLFAKAKGFGICIRSSKQNSCIFVHGSEGKHKIKSHENEENNGNGGRVKKKYSTMHIGCRASLIVSKNKKRDIWVIKYFDNNHNHDMVSPKSVSYFKCYRKMDTIARNLVEKFNEEGLLVGKVATMFNGSNLTFSSRDCWNRMKYVRMTNLDVGDAQVVLFLLQIKASLKF